MEVTQFTYFQQVGGFECNPVPVEIAYGLERLTMFVQGVDSMFDIVWSRGADGVTFTYGDVYLENERQYSTFNFEVADTDFLFQEFNDREEECKRTLAANLPLPAYDSVLKCCHTFNLLDARGVISATERMAYILRVRTLAKAVCASVHGARGGHEARRAKGRRPTVASLHTLAFEIGTEEIPAFDLHKATGQLEKLVPEALDAVRIPHGTVSVHTTPRRLIVLAEDVADETEALQEVFRGPSAKIAFDAEGNPTKAAIGFARGKGLDVEALERREENGAEYVFARAQRARPRRGGAFARRAGGRDHRHLLAEVVPLGHPQRVLLAPGALARGPARRARGARASSRASTAGRLTRGHRFLAPGPHEVATAADLLPAWCEGAFVVHERAGARAAHPRRAWRRRRPQTGYRAELPEKTLLEVVNLSEYPTVLVGTFDEEFLRVPEEIIVDAMLMHQRYFPLYDGDGKLTNKFIVVTNGDPAACRHHHRRQRARGARAPVRCEVLLRGGPEAPAGDVRRPPGRGGVPGGARHHEGQDRPHRGAGARTWPPTRSWARRTPPMPSAPRTWRRPTS